MKTPSYLNEAEFQRLVEDVVTKAKSAREVARANLRSNVLDPFAAVFEAAIAGKSIEDWYFDEENRQVQKTIQNAIGTFHQELLGSMPGWENLGVGGGVDVRSEEFRIVAEVKNKHNTMNAASSEATFEKLSNWLRYRDRDGFIAYLVKIVPKSPARFDRPWTHSARLNPAREDIREIDGYSFYAKVTGDDTALKTIYDALRKELGRLTDDKALSLLSDPQAKILFDDTYGK